MEYFKKQVLEEGSDRPRMDGVWFNKISEVGNDRLVDIFTEEEIEGAVKESDGNKSPVRVGLILLSSSNFGIC